MEQSDFDSITARVRHLRENIAELQKNYDQLILNVKVSGKLKSGSPSVTQKEGVQQAEPQQVFQVPEPGNANSAYTSPSSKEKVLGSGETISAYTSSSSKLEETEHLASKPDVSGQSSTSGVKERERDQSETSKGSKRVNTNVAGVKFDATHFITDVSGKYPRLWALKGAHLVIVNRKYKFRALASIRTVAPGFREISELPYWVFNVVHESWHNNPHLKRGEELEIKFITTTSEDITNSIQYPSFHFMKLQMPDQRAFTYIKAQETKPALVVNLTEDEVSTRRA
ncbi:hypothetical protein ACS0TY_033271 [Phlomoides rotata]